MHKFFPSPVQLSLKQASIEFVGDSLVVDTGTFRRVWNWTGGGFVTTNLYFQQE